MAKHGGGMTWQPITYDPELNLIYVTTGNPQPVVAFKNREGANLYTASVVALDADTGKMAWYFQTSPHDTHDWDSTQPPVLFDGTFDGQPRKLLGIAARNGHFFVLDRTNGRALVSVEYVKTNWALGYDDKGQPVPNPAKRPQIAGSLVTPNQGGATNWYPASFSPLDGPLLRHRQPRVQHLVHLRPERQPDGLGRHRSRRLRGAGPDQGDRLPHAAACAGAFRATAGTRVFSARPATSCSGRARAALPRSMRRPVRRCGILASAVLTNGPITYELDGRQYVVAGVGTRIAAFVLNE